MDSRYARQELFYGFGKEAQEELAKSRVAIVGMGALGTVIAEELVREGVGYIRIMDGDKVELINLHRQFLYTEQDVEEKTPKVVAAANHLRKYNSEVVIDSVSDLLNAETGEEYLKDMNLVIDATDNLDTRYLINEICVKYQIPWIYGGCVEAEGMTMVFTPEGPCFACMSGSDVPVTMPGGPKTSANAGVINSATAITASLEALEATKLLIGSNKVRKGLLHYRLWENSFDLEPIEKLDNCPICRKKQYRYLK